MGRNFNDEHNFPLWAIWIQFLFLSCEFSQFTQPFFLSIALYIKNDMRVINILTENCTSYKLI